MQEEQRIQEEERRVKQLKQQQQQQQKQRLQALTAEQEPPKTILRTDLNNFDKASTYTATTTNNWQEVEDESMPPLLKKVSWTQAAPFKEEKYYRTASDSIGNCFSPAASHLNMTIIASVSGAQKRSGSGSLPSPTHSHSQSPTRGAF